MTTKLIAPPCFEERLREFFLQSAFESCRLLGYDLLNDDARREMYAFTDECMGALKELKFVELRHTPKFGPREQDFAECSPLVSK